MSAYLRSGTSVSPLHKKSAVVSNYAGYEAPRRWCHVQSMPILPSIFWLQLGPSVISPGLRERVLDQLSMHFQLLVQTGILAAKVGLALSGAACVWGIVG